MSISIFSLFMKSVIGDDSTFQFEYILVNFGNMYILTQLNKFKYSNKYK